MHTYGHGEWTIEITSAEQDYGVRLRFDTVDRADDYARIFVETATGCGYDFQESRVYNDRRVWWGLQHAPEGHTVKLVRNRPLPTRILRCAHIAAFGKCLACGEPVEEPA